MKISAFTVLSEPEKYNYPYLEAIKSFLPLVDELVVVYNILPDFQDGSLERIKAIGDPKIKIVAGLFNYKRFGWASQGIMRTNGYYAATGDIVLMFDADGILHEKDVDKCRQALEQVHSNGSAYGFWMKHRIFKPDIGIRQCKHSGFYNKSVLGNSFNFYGKDANYAPNWESLPKELDRGQQIDVYLYGYERLWDTKEIFVEKLKFRRIMESSQRSVPSEEQYIKDYLAEVEDRKTREHITLSLGDHPAIIQEKIKTITFEMFGFNNFKGEELPI